LTEITKLKDGNNFTAYFVRRAFHAKQVLGVTDEKAGVALIGDDRSDRTLAHEAGHYLGSHNDSGTFTSTYGHPGVDNDLMREVARDGESPTARSRISIAVTRRSLEPQHARVGSPGSGQRIACHAIGGPNASADAYFESP